MNNTEQARVVFFQITLPQQKLMRLTEVAEHHFSNQEHLLIIGEDDRALQYVDELLWNFSQESFLPHAIIDAESNEYIAITKLKKNLNHARYIINLCSTPLIIEENIRIIYDFEDNTSQHKKMLSAIRFDAYKQAQFLIESRIK